MAFGAAEQRTPHAATTAKASKSQKPFLPMQPLRVPQAQGQPPLQQVQALELFPHPNPLNPAPPPTRPSNPAQAAQKSDSVLLLAWFYSLL
jgi:hypothetical protein